MTITYVDDRHRDRDWQLAAPVAVVENIEDYLAMNVSGDVLIIHSGHRDARTRIDNGRELLIEAIVRVCSGGGRAIIFSGGAGMITARELRGRLAGESLEEGVHYLLLTAIQNLHAEIDFELLNKTKPSPEWRIIEAKRRHATPTLLTLGLLCQSALLAFDPRKIDDETAALLGGREAMAAVRGSVAFTGEQLLSPQSWHGALGTRSADTVQEAIEREWPAGAQQDTGLQALVDALFERVRPLDPDTVSRAFSDLYRALLRSQELQH